MREISDGERELLRRFLKLDVRVDELVGRFAGLFTFDYSEDVRFFSSNLLLVEPGIEVTIDDIRHAVAAEADGRISAEELCRWATMLRINDAFVWEGDGDRVGEALDALSMPKMFGRLEWL